MHYFKRNIGDYHKKAGRLTMLQHGAYTLLMDACYDRERFPTLEDAIDWCWASSDEEIAAVKFVLGKFFDLVDGQYQQTRIQEEIDDFHGKSETNRRIALEREEKRRNRPRSVDKEARSVLEPSPEKHEAPPNQEPLTTNQEPVTREKTPRGSRLPTDQQLPVEWIEWTAVNRPDLNPQAVFDGFKDYWIGKPGKEGVKLDWLATWRNWCRTQKAPSAGSTRPTGRHTGFDDIDYTKGFE